MHMMQIAGRVMRAGALAAFVLALAAPAGAQQTPQPIRKVTQAEADLARDVMVTKGIAGIFDAVIPGVVEQSKNTLLMQNPMLQKDINDVAAQLRKDYAPRVNEVVGEVAKIYASYFTEQELKDLLAFYKSPLGMKVTANEPRALDQGLGLGQQWAVKFSDEVMAKMRAELKKKGHDL